MRRRRYAGHHSICQTLRDIYALTDNEEIKMKCRVGVAMAKAMQEKLKWYKQKEIQSGQSKHSDTVPQL